MNNDFRRLKADRLIETADILASRLVGRFPQASLGKVAVTISEITRDAVARAEKINRPNWWLRGGLLAMALLVGIASLNLFFNPGEGESAPRGFLERVLFFMNQTRGAAVYLGASIVFFWTLETRFKRGKAVKAIHELRALAHIIDMHQLAKDPDCGPGENDDIKSREDMIQYLAFCTELLALVSKIGQLYVEDFPDGTTLASVDQFENLATGLSRKIWQKIMILRDLPATPSGKMDPT